MSSVTMKAHVVFFADVVDREDVGMIQPARGAGFFQQAMPASRVAGQFVAQNLQRDFAAQARIPGAIHLAHAAGVERPDDFVTPNPLTRFAWHGRKPI